uniref:Perilipin 1 n=1 Tax=Podarcis muralis TaxID=64176 RepID=A0A670JZD1_PODMU|nr:perilipin-1 [Podarcis muralis]XP_028562822.1 perilipin-1 [Podarcis muralis]
MAAKSKQLMQNGTPKGNDNALERVLHLPVVNSACSNLQKAYSVTKQVHPLMASMCGAYERGLQNASSIAASSVKPVVKKLEPQLAAANILTCRGLDHLEQKIPALNQPVEKVTSDLKDSIVTYMQSAMRSVMHTLDRVMGLGVKSCKQPKGSLRDTAEYARTSRVSQLAEAGVDAAIGKLEKLVDFFLPKTEHESVHKPPVRCELSTFGRIRSLAATAFHRAYKKTTQNIQHVRDKGQDLATWIPGLVVLARQSSKKVLKIITGVQSAETGWLSKKVQKVPKKEEETKKDDTGRKTAKQVEAQSLVGSVSQNLQTSCFSIASRVKDAPATVWNAAGQLLQVSPQRAMSEAGDKVDLLKETFHNITSNLLGTFSSYVPVPKISVKQEETASVSMANSESSQDQEGTQPVSTDAEEEKRGLAYQLLGIRRSSRGHHPLSFLNLDEPLPPQPAPYQHRSPAFEAEYAGSRKSAFSPYKDWAGSRRMSEGLCRPSSQVVYTRAHASLYSTTFKKD